MTATTIPAHRPGAAAWGQLIAHEWRMVRRDTAGLVIPLGLPLLIMVMNGLGSTAHEALPELGGLSPFSAYIVPLALVLVVATIGVVNMPSFLAIYRRSGILRRLAVTPASPTMVLVAQLVVSLAQILVGIAIALGVGVAVFDLSAPRNVGGAIVALVLLISAMYALGMLVAALSPTANSAVAIGLVAFFAMMALGGGFGDRQNLPGPLARIGELLPFGAGHEALMTSWIGNTPQLLHLGALVAVTVVAGVAAAKLFRWE